MGTRGAAAVVAASEGILWAQQAVGMVVVGKETAGGRWAAQAAVGEKKVEAARREAVGERTVGTAGREVVVERGAAPR